LTSNTSTPVPRPSHRPHRADPPGRYWGNYELYQKRGGQMRLEEDIKGLLGDAPSYGDISRFYFFCLAFDQMTKEGVTGDILELGTYRGATATVLAKMARRLGTTAWILDTFQGFNDADLQGIDASHRMEFADTSLEAVRALVGEQNVRYVRGYFPGSAAQLPDDLSFCLVHIDCDLYAPIRSALEYFYPRIVPGGYLIVHDYACLAWDGAERAVDEFFADKPEAVIPLTDGCGSAVIRKAKAGGTKSNWLMQKRCALFTSEWTSAGKSALLDILGSGWSGGEDWGTWGIGSSHVINLSMNDRPTQDLEIEVDGAAAVFQGRPEQEIEVFVDGQCLTTWYFSLTQNRAQRKVRVPAAMVGTGEWGFPLLHLEFRPRSFARIVDIDPARKDERALGLALFGIRRVE
jgi:hypothetical protein